MPRHVISDAHEWSDEIPGVPTARGETTAKGTGLVCQRGKKTLLSLTLVVRAGMCAGGQFCLCVWPGECGDGEFGWGGTAARGERRRPRVSLSGRETTM
jgi:hypothetical protein